jgi:hypothetical protein
MKTIQQIDVRMKNEPGVLSDISTLLGENRVNIIAFYVTTNASEGLLHFVADDPEKAINVLKSADYDMDMKEVIACEVPHHPGGLNVVLRLLKDAGINVEYVYPCIGTGDITVLIVGVSQIKDALSVLNDNWMRVLGKELYHI